MGSTTAKAELLENVIGGRRVGAETSDVLDVLDPATGEPLARVPLSGAADVDRAARAAHEAWPKWAETPVPERARLRLGPSRRGRES